MKDTSPDFLLCEKLVNKKAIKPGKLRKKVALFASLLCLDFGRLCKVQKQEKVALFEFC